MLKALIKTRGLFERWKNCSDNNSFLDKNRQSEEREWASTELKNALRSIEWDLEDLEDTVNIVEKNPTKFRIDVAELEVRKKFILQTKEEVRIMKAKANQMNSHTPAETVRLLCHDLSNVLSFGPLKLG